MVISWANTTLFLLITKIWAISFGYQITSSPSSPETHSWIWLGFLFHLLPIPAKPLGIVESCHSQGELSALVSEFCGCIFLTIATQWNQTHRKRCQLLGRGRGHSGSCWLFSSSLRKEARNTIISWLLWALGHHGHSVLGKSPHFHCENKSSLFSWKYLLKAFQSRGGDYKGAFTETVHPLNNLENTCETGWRRT